MRPASESVILPLIAPAMYLLGFTVAKYQEVSDVKEKEVR